MNYEEESDAVFNYINTNEVHGIDFDEKFKNKTWKKWKI